MTRAETVSAGLLAALAGQPARAVANADGASRWRRPRVLLAMVLLLMFAMVSITVGYAAYYGSADGSASQALMPPVQIDAASGNSYADAQTLNALVEQDRPAGRALALAPHTRGSTGSWVPQVMSLRKGLVADGTVYNPTTILAAVVRARLRWPQALVLESGDFSTYRTSRFWVVVVPPGYASSDQANAWCALQGLGPEDCYAKRLSVD